MKSLRIAQLGSYGINVGDNIALHNIRVHLNQLVPNIHWTSLPIQEFFNKQNETHWVQKKFKKLSSRYDLLIVGGGGLIEGAGYKELDSGYKLPFTEKTLPYLSIPIICVGLGVNDFRGVDGLDSRGIHELGFLIDQSDFFSVRNDGSFELLRSMLPEKKVREIPDPGLLMAFESPHRTSIRSGVFQPAWNLGKNILEGRRLTENAIKNLESIVAEYQLKVLPHTVKDYAFSDRAYVDRATFEKLVAFDKFDHLIRLYLDFDYMVAMRGHSQLISIGLGLPCISFSTQDKVSTFAKKHSFDDFLVDILEEDWPNKLGEKIAQLTSDRAFLTQWHDIRMARMNSFRTSWWSFLSEVAHFIQTSRQG